METTLGEGIDWVGYVDWTVRDFHGYQTNRGSTYNAYLIVDEKTALIDTVKAPYADRLLANVAALTDPAKVDYLVCNHAEPDHSGSLAAMVAACPNAEVVCDAKCREALVRHYGAEDWPFRVVADGETLSLGRRSLQFIETPMVHWPESMATYCPEEKLLFSMDGFGQHYASAGRFDDLEPLDVVLAEAKTYYANILMLYGKPIGRTLARAEELDIEMIAPSHGVIWRDRPDLILDAYRDWIVQRPDAKVLVVYDTMWQSTRRMAEAILEGAIAEDVRARLINVRASNITELATEVLDVAAIAVGSPTLNSTLMPQMAAALTYLKGLKPAGKAGFAFGSYGWAKVGALDVQRYLEQMRFLLLREPLISQFVPSDACLEECRAAGRELAETAVRLAAAEAEATSAG
jgi:flavorubredoxin